MSRTLLSESLSQQASKTNSSAVLQVPLQSGKFMQLVSPVYVLEEVSGPRYGHFSRRCTSLWRWLRRELVPLPKNQLKLGFCHWQEMSTTPGVSVLSWRSSRGRCVVSCTLVSETLSLSDGARVDTRPSSRRADRWCIRSRLCRPETSQREVPKSWNEVHTSQIGTVASCDSWNLTKRFRFTWSFVVLCMLDFFFSLSLLVRSAVHWVLLPSVFWSCGRNLNRDVHTTCAILLFSAAREMRSLQDATCSRANPGSRRGTWPPCERQQRTTAFMELVAWLSASFWLGVPLWWSAHLERVTLSLTVHFPVSRERASQLAAKLLESIHGHRGRQEAILVRSQPQGFRMSEPKSRGVQRCSQGNHWVLHRCLNEFMNSSRAMANCDLFTRDLGWTKNKEQPHPWNLLLACLPFLQIFLSGGSPVSRERCWW